MRVEEVWAAQAALDRDVLNVFVVRYWWDDHSTRPTRCQHLRADGGWHVHNEYTRMEPALSIPGWLIHRLPNTNQFYPTLEQQQVMELLERVVGRA